MVYIFRLSPRRRFRRRDKIEPTRARFRVSRLWHLGALRSRDSGVSGSVKFVIIIARIYMSRDDVDGFVCRITYAFSLARFAS